MLITDYSVVYCSIRYAVTPSCISLRVLFGVQFSNPSAKLDAPMYECLIFVQKSLEGQWTELLGGADDETKIKNERERWWV